MSVGKLAISEYNGRTIQEAAVLEAWRVPAAVDLFGARGALTAGQTSIEGKNGGWGAMCLLPERGAADVRSLRAERLLVGEKQVEEVAPLCMRMGDPEGIQTVDVSGAKLVPLPSALREDGTMADIGLLCAHGERLFCLPDGFMDLKRLRALFCYASSFPVRIAFRPCLNELCEGGQINEGPVADRLGMKGLPAVAESLAAEMVLTLAAEYGVPVHVRTVSCAATLAAIERARANGLDVTCDVAIANLLHTEDEIRIDSLCSTLKTFPPLRSPDERTALWKALDEGKIDAIVTNCRTRSLDEMSLPFEQIPFGWEPWKCYLDEFLDSWEEQSRPCAIERLLGALSSGPRKILGEDSSIADLVDNMGVTIAVRTDRGWLVEYDAQQDDCNVEYDFPEMEDDDER
ncbi:MAG: hypothetical protein IJ233_11475 [Pyramidobacter sp.]|nr:hypothetical protein [Pyramidobacter sp.]